MDIRQDGVKIFCLPDEANCQADKERRSPLDIEECPIGHEECDGNCFYYSETIN